MSTGDDEPTGSLTMLQLQTWNDRGYQWHLRLNPVDLIRLCSDPAHTAIMLFRRLLIITRPYRAEWEEQRNRSLLQLVVNDEQGRVLSSWWSDAYPAEAVPSRWLISPSLYPPHHPSGVWWFNYWHPEIVSEFGRDVLQGLPVAHVEEMEDGGFLFWLCDELFTIDRPDHLKIQRRALEHLGFRQHQIKWVEPRNRSLLAEWHGPLPPDL